MVGVYKNFKNILIYKKGFLYILYSFCFLTISSNLYSINYEESFFKKEIKRYPIESKINSVGYRSYIIYGIDRIEDIIDSKILKRFFIVENTQTGSSVGSIYIYPKLLNEDIFIIINSFDLKTLSFKIISFFKKNFIESLTNKKDIPYLGRLDLSNLKKDINIDQSISYKINDISIYTHLIHSKNSTVLDKIFLSLKNAGFLNIHSSLKDRPVLYSMWKSRNDKYTNKDSIVYLEYFSNTNKNLILNPMYFLNLDTNFEMEMNIYEIF